MSDREMIECLLSALEYHEEQTRPIHFTTTAIQAAREHLRAVAPAALAQRQAETNPAPGYCKHCKQYSIEEPMYAQQSPTETQSAHGGVTGEIVAMRGDFDGYGYRYIDSGSGSDWRTRNPDWEPLVVAVLAKDERAEQAARMLTDEEMPTLPEYFYDEKARQWQYRYARAAIEAFCKANGIKIGESNG